MGQHPVKRLNPLNPFTLVPFHVSPAPLVMLYQAFIGLFMVYPIRAVTCLSFQLAQGNIRQPLLCVYEHIGDYLHHLYL